MSVLWGTSARFTNKGGRVAWFLLGIVSGIVLVWMVDAMRYVGNGGLR